MPVYVPSSANSIVYFDGSSGVAFVSFEYRLSCHCQVTPVRLVSAAPSSPPSSLESPPPHAATASARSSPMSRSARRMARA